MSTKLFFGGGAGGGPTVIDALNSIDASAALSANQGRILNERLITVEGEILEIEIFENITADTGTVTIPAGAGIILDQYENAGDCLITRTDGNGKPVDEPARDSGGNIITGTFDIAGNYTLSGTPAGYPVSILFQIQIPLKDLANVPIQNIVNTSKLSNSDKVSNVSTVAGDTVSDALEGLRAEIDSDRTVNRDPSGFSFPENVIVSYDVASRTVTVTGQTDFYYQGVRIPEMVSGWVSPAHDSTVGKTYFLYYDGSAFVWGDSFIEFYPPLVAMVVYRAADKFAVRESHGIQDWNSHRTDHFNIGTWRQSGGDISGVVLNSSTPADRRPDVSETIIWDEDCPTTNPALTTKTYSIRRNDGTDVSYIKGSADIVPIVAGIPQYNLFSGGVWSQANLPDNSFMTVWLYAVPVTADANSQDYRFAFVQGQSFTTAASPSPAALLTAQAQEEAKNTQELNLLQSAGISSEFVCIQKFIIRRNGAAWSIANSIRVTGSRAIQVGSVSGSFLFSVAIATAPVGASHFRTAFNLQVPGSVQLDYDGNDISASYDADAAAYGRIYTGSTWRLAIRPGDFLRQRGGNGGASVGDTQEDQFQGHFHNFMFTYGQTTSNAYSGNLMHPDAPFAKDFTGNAVKNPISDGTNGTPRTGNETRPVNTAGEYWIRVA